ncbi:MAG: hypothetical protein ABEJ65_11845 [bacterium]
MIERTGGRRTFTPTLLGDRHIGGSTKGTNWEQRKKIFTDFGDQDNE